ncbi:MAG: DUF2141 domain-containing protein [Planctomycetota bacterium]
MQSRANPETIGCVLAVVMLLAASGCTPKQNSTDDQTANPPVIEQESTISIVIRGAASAEGTIRIVTYENADSFPNNELATESLHVDAVTGDIKATMRWHGASPIAVGAFHDENLDGELNRNAFGIPTERYGFSNDARAKLGPPTFSDASVDPSAVDPIVIQLH